MTDRPVAREAQAGCTQIRRVEDERNPLAPRPLPERTGQAGSGDGVAKGVGGASAAESEPLEATGSGRPPGGRSRGPCARVRGTGTPMGGRGARLGRGPSPASAVLGLWPLRGDPFRDAGTERRGRTGRPDWTPAQASAHRDARPGALSTSPPPPVCWARRRRPWLGSGGAGPWASGPRAGAEGPWARASVAAGPSGQGGRAGGARPLSGGRSPWWQQPSVRVYPPFPARHFQGQ